MTICPIAVVAGCARCPAVKICPLKTVIGDAAKPDVHSAPTQPRETRRKDKTK